ncbi:Heavy-metal resistance protein CzcE [Ralstonia sp. 25mfcol4.1]|uniref:CzcE family metal-binding protein n=1 Tax=Ralstonia sp. 25mfcol4.1 TaxID=1761899 RepID=UPI000887FB1C|nr:CzcE family metal-binding protein [Ralstonia sp. 25mfcol4.1]SDO97890.1 Heavy-metal resistance protein CzcE [Ralstonia sp. 25mfcol4.1]
MMTSKTLLTPALLLAPVLAWSAPAPTPVSHDAALFGSPATAQTVGRTLTIGPDTRFVTVASGESVAIRAGGQTVNWTFLEALNGATMPLRVLMPGTQQASGVYIHVAPSEVYSAG